MSSTRGRGLAAVLLLALAMPLSGCSLIEDEEGAIEASGTIEGRSVTVVAPYGGRVASVHAREGDAVARGQLLVALDAALVDAAIVEAMAALEAAEADLDRVTADPREEEIRYAEAQLSGAIAQWDGARRAWDAAEAALRVAEASGDAGATRSARSAAVQAAAAYRQAEAAADAARAGLDALLSGPDEVEVAAAQAAVAQAQAGIAELMARREGNDLVAPIAGEITTISVGPGSLAAPGTMVARVADLSEVTLRIYVAETDIGDVALDQEVEVTVDGFPDETFAGKVSHIATEAEFTPRNVQTQDQRANLVFAVEVAIPNEEGRLRPGMPADARIEID